MEKKIMRELPVKLTDEQKKARSNKLAEVTLDLDRVIGDKTLACADFNKTIKERRKEIKTLAKAVNSGEETVEIECFEREIFATNTIEVVRRDTNEVVEKRAMTAEERNAELPFDGATTGKKKKLKGGKKAEETNGVAETTDEAAAAPAEVQ